MLNDPARTGAQRAEALLGLLDDSLSTAVRNFVVVMAENDRLALLPDVVCQFAALKAELESTVTVEVTSAYDLGVEEAERLQSFLSRRLNRTVSLTTHTDPALLGGALIRAGDLVIDGSVRGRLEKLAGALTP
jgi:F-type H+-transporting ATPase subunit delta